MKDKQLKTLRLFRTKAEVGAWGGIHHAHFDWWMFPIGELPNLARTIAAIGVRTNRRDLGWRAS